MPHLRFSRDKRGYENTFVVHTGRRKGKSRPRILYWFRTPPGVRVGRSALDEAAIRLIEEHNPEVEFDWTRILKGQAAEAKPAPPTARERFDRGGRRRPEPRPWPAAPAQQASPPPASAPAVDAGEEALVEIDAAPIEAIEIESESAGDIDAVEQGLTEPPSEGDTVAQGPQDEAPPTPAHGRLGSEGVLRLRARYAEVLARISERIPDPARQDELRTQAERLNPDTWVTDAEVGEGLEEYETVFEVLRAAVGGHGHGRRHKRRRGPEKPKTEDLKTDDS